jgi:hypothetical protein
MKKVLVATGMVVATATSMANAVEIGGVKVTPNIEVGWQKGKYDGEFSGVASGGYVYAGNASANATSEFGVGQVGLEIQSKNYFGGVKYTRDRYKGSADLNASDNQGNTFAATRTYSLVLERYSTYAGYEFKLNNLELKPYASVGYFNSNLDKGNFAGLGVVSKLNLPYGFSVFLGGEYDKTFGGKTKVENAVDKNIKDTWEVSIGASKKISFAETYIKAYYREHKGDVTDTGGSNGTSYTQTTNLLCPIIENHKIVYFFCIHFIPFL